MHSKSNLTTNFFREIALSQSDGKPNWGDISIIAPMMHKIGKILAIARLVNKVIFMDVLVGWDKELEYKHGESGEGIIIPRGSAAV